MGRAKAADTARDAWESSGASDRASELAAYASELARRGTKALADAKLDEKALDLAERARTKMKESGMDKQAAQLADRAREAAKDAEIAARAAALADRGRDAIEDIDVDDIKKRVEKGRKDLTKDAKKAWKQAKKSDAAKDAKKAWKQAKKSDAAKDAQKAWKKAKKSDAAKQASHMGEAGLAAVGGWLASGPAADALGVQPKRRIPGWLLFVLGAGVGYLAGTLLAPKKGEDLRHDLLASAERLASDAPDVPDVAGMADAVRARLGADPRTKDATTLSINVAEGTVFVRGSVPEGVDTEVLEEVVSAVPGVVDVDLQVSPATG